MQWEIRDPAFAGLTILLDAVPLSAAEGFALRLSAQGAQAGDRLIWAFGGSMPAKDASRDYDPVACNRNDPNLEVLSPVIRSRFQPGDCKDNQVRIEAGRFLLTTRGVVRNVSGCCTRGDLRLADGSAWDDPAKLPSSSVGVLPLACGVLALSDPRETYWAVEALGENHHASAACDDPAEAFSRAVKRVDAVGRQVVVATPDARLNAAVAAACYAVDSTFYLRNRIRSGWHLCRRGRRRSLGQLRSLGRHKVRPSPSGCPSSPDLGTWSTVSPAGGLSPGDPSGWFFRLTTPHAFFCLHLLYPSEVNTDGERAIVVP